MDANQIVECAMRGIEIGSHGRNPVNLTKVPLVEAKNEILASQRELEDLVGTEITSFCYPYGSFNNDLTKICITSSYKSSVSMLRGRCHLKQDHYHSLPRIPINWRTTLPQFLLKITTSYEDRRA